MTKDKLDMMLNWVETTAITAMTSGAERKVRAALGGMVIYNLPDDHVIFTKEKEEQMSFMAQKISLKMLELGLIS